MERGGEVWMGEERAGWIIEDDNGYTFIYDRSYLASAHPPISFTLPKRVEPYRSKTMIPFFDNLIPEGWLLITSARQWKLNERDRMGLLLSVCEDTIGAASIRRIEELPAEVPA